MNLGHLETFLVQNQETDVEVSTLNITSESQRQMCSDLFPGFRFPLSTSL